MMYLIYRGMTYPRTEIVAQAKFPVKTAKYRGCIYNTSAETQMQPTPKPKLTYRGCSIA